MKIKRKEKYILLVLLILIIVLLFLGGRIISKNIKAKRFASQEFKVYENNQEQVFKIEKIIVCSSAGATDLSEKQNLQDLNIYQYTDIAVYIDNGEELSNKNTIKELYIDNISLEGPNDIGQKSLNYKNINKLGLKKDAIKKSNQNDGVFSSLNNNTNTSNSIDVGSIATNETDNTTENVDDEQENQDNIQNERIDFNIVYTNEENDSANYNNPTFYTDCSNPITIEYLNNDIVTHYKMDENKTIAFDGSILKEAGVDLQTLSCKVKFKINIVNNMNQKYSCWINFEIPLDDIYEGTTLKGKTTNNQKYIFFRE